VNTFLSILAWVWITASALVVCAVVVIEIREWKEPWREFVHWWRLKRDPQHDRSSCACCCVDCDPNW